MLRIYSDILDWLSALVPLIDKIGRHDPDLAKQLKRAGRSVALNCAEGMYARGGSRITACDACAPNIPGYFVAECNISGRCVVTIPE
jgi:hypothetical protein